MVRRSASQRDESNAPRPDRPAPSAPAGPPAVALLRSMQRSAGNRATAAMVQRSAAFGAPKAVGLEEMADLAAVHHDGDGHAGHAGSPTVDPAPDGYNDLDSKSKSGLGAPAGLTLIPNAVAFTTPQFKTTASHNRTPTTVEHFATIDQPAASPDVVHDCWYLGQGRHKWGTAGTKYAHKGKKYLPVIEVSQPTSDLIKAGEQEHLNDAKQSYDMTYGLIVSKMQALAGTKYGPATTPDNAYQLALNAFSATLPPVLSITPPNTTSVWPRTLDDLLGQSKKVRDESGFHQVEINQSGSYWDDATLEHVYPLATTGKTKIPSDPSNTAIKYPSAAAAAPAQGGQANPVTILREDDEEASGDGDSSTTTDTTIDSTADSTSTTETTESTDGGQTAGATTESTSDGGTDQTAEDSSPEDETEDVTPGVLTF